MSDYLPISPWKIAEKIQAEGLIIPQPGTAEFLSTNHERIEAESRALCAALCDTHRVPAPLRPQFEQNFEAIGTFVGLTNNADWAKVYGTHLIRDVCCAVFGKNVLVEMLRPRRTRRRLMLVGDMGSGRQGIGDSVRRVMVECLVRGMGWGVANADSVSAKISVGHDAIEGELFGGIRTTKGEQPLGLLSLCHDSVLYLDGLLEIPESLQRRLLDLVDVADAGHATRLASRAGGGHLLVGVRPEDLPGAQPNSTPLLRAFFQALCRDGLIEIPSLTELLATERDWASLFSFIYRRVATSYVGIPVQMLHHYGSKTPSRISKQFDSEVIAQEQARFLEWACQPEKVGRLTAIAQSAFAGYDWPGNLRELEALAQRLIDAQADGSFDGASLQMVCEEFRKGRRGPEMSGLTASWLDMFSDDLELLPLSDGSLPEVLAAVEVRYYKAAAKKAALARHPKPARIQDVSRLLGVPRQTVARKWQQHELPSALLSHDQD